MILKDCKYKYLDYLGIVKFVGEDYVSFCIKPGEDRLSDVCIIVYKQDWFKLSLVNTF